MKPFKKEHEFEFNNEKLYIYTMADKRDAICNMKALKNIKPKVNKVQGSVQQLHWNLHQDDSNQRNIHSDWLRTVTLTIPSAFENGFGPEILGFLFW